MSRDRLITPEQRAELLANGARSAAGHDTDPATVVKLVHPGRRGDRASRKTPMSQRFKTAFISAPHRGFIYILEREGARKEGRRLIASRMPERGREGDVLVPLATVPLAIRRAARDHLGPPRTRREP